MMEFFDTAEFVYKNRLIYTAHFYKLLWNEFTDFKYIKRNNYTFIEINQRTNRF